MDLNKVKEMITEFGLDNYYSSGEAQAGSKIAQGIVLASFIIGEAIKDATDNYVSNK